MTRAERIVRELLSSADLPRGFSLTADRSRVVVHHDRSASSTWTDVEQFDDDESALVMAGSEIEDFVSEELAEPWFPFTRTWPRGCPR